MLHAVSRWVGTLPEVHMGYIALLALDAGELEEDLLQADAFVHGEQDAGGFLGQQVARSHKTNLFLEIIINYLQECFK